MDTGFHRLYIIDNNIIHTYIMLQNHTILYDARPTKKKIHNRTFCFHDFKSYSETATYLFKEEDLLLTTIEFASITGIPFYFTDIVYTFPKQFQIFVKNFIEKIIEQEGV